MDYQPTGARDIAKTVIIEVLIATCCTIATEVVVYGFDAMRRKYKVWRDSKETDHAK